MGKTTPRVRCGQCEACRNPDCGSCNWCKKKKKFGGDGSCRMACLMRRCTNLQDRKSFQAPPTKPPPRKRAPPRPSENSPPSQSSLAKKRANSSSGLIEVETVNAAVTTAPRKPTHMYGLPIPDAVQDVCAGCRGERNEELKDDAILLCDGPGCGCEYHMACCLPPLTQVPEEHFYCVDCQPDGSTSQLQEYFDKAAEVRATYETSRDYVEFLLNQQLVVYNQAEPRTPRSQLERLSESVSDAACSIQRKASSTLGSLEETKRLGPDYLVGKPLQLYCPEDNQFHHGRILDWRRATHLVPTSALSVNDDRSFHGSTEIAKCEFFVAFPAGMDYRKRTLHQWLILEEHCMVVGASLIWGKTQTKKGRTGWMPAQTWLRTSLELVHLRDQLMESEGQISYMDQPPPPSKHPVWALTEFFGKSNHALLALREEAVDFFNEPFARERLTMESSPGKAGATEFGWTNVAVALARVEAEEQKRVRRWHCMPLRNMAHRRALSIADESVLPPIVMAEQKLSETAPKPCPLIPRGLDRMYIMDMLQKRSVDMSKDTAASLTCAAVQSRTAAIQQLQQF